MGRKLECPIEIIVSEPMNYKLQIDSAYFNRDHQIIGEVHKNLNSGLVT